MRRGSGVAARQATREPARGERRCVQPWISSDTARPRRRRRNRGAPPASRPASGSRRGRSPTAPRRPTQEMNSFSRHWKRNGARHRNTAAGRAISISTSATASAGQSCCGSRSRPGQQAEQHEHHDLRQPGDGVEERHDDVVRAGLPVADDQAGEIDREKARAVQRLGEARTSPARRPRRTARAGPAAARGG